MYSGAKRLVGIDSPRAKMCSKISEKIGTCTDDSSSRQVIAVQDTMQTYSKVSEIKDRYMSIEMRAEVTNIEQITKYHLPKLVRDSNNDSLNYSNGQSYLETK
jgi:hypothetical protein